MVIIFKKIFCFSLFFLLVLPFIHAGSLGMSPSYFKFNFEPGLEETLVIKVADSDVSQPISIYVSGDLSEYVNVSATSFVGVGSLEVSIKLPNAIAKPGNHRIIIGSREDKNVSVDGAIGGVSAIQVPIDIFVPYPGRYAEAEFSISNANENEDIPYKLVVSNLGTQSIDFSYSIEIFGDFFNSSLITFGNSGFLEANSKMTLEEVIKGVPLKPGNYLGFAKINYGSEISLNSSFVIGTFFVNITDYDYEFIAGQINPFVLNVSSSWNSVIEEVYAVVSVTDQGVPKSYFKTAGYSFAPLEERKLEGYIDATNITPGRYIGSIVLNYDGKTTSKLVAFYFYKPQLTKTEKLLYSAIGVIALFVLITAILLVKLFLVRRRRGDKK